LYNIEPILCLFFIIAYLPFLLIRLFSLKKWFINTILGVEGYRGRKFWRYIVITCTKPDDIIRRRGLDVLEVIKENKNT
jgi:sterol 24-C-methyltransferase